MARKKRKNLDLGDMFQAVSKNLDKHRTDLNQADSYNHNHGDNMVEIFSTIAEAVATKKRSRPATQLAYASKLVEQRAQSGSAKAYANGLAQASQEFKGKAITPDNLSTLLGALLGGQAAGSPSSSPTGDLLGGLLGGLGGEPGGGAQAIDLSPDLLDSLMGSPSGGQAASQPSGSTADLLGSLLGGLAGGAQGGSTQAGINMGDLLNAGMAFMGSQQQGNSTLQSLIKAFVAATQTGQSPHRAQSGELVVNSILQELENQRRR